MSNGSMGSSKRAYPNPQVIPAATQKINAVLMIIKNKKDMD